MPASMCVVFLISSYMLVKEVATIKPRKPLTPQQQRINTLQQQVKRSQQAVKAERQRQRIAKAQQQLSKANQSKPTL
jgi:hypothetical protein